MKRTSSSPVYLQYTNNSHENLSQTITLLNKHYPLPNGNTYTTSDADLFRNICFAVSNRSAALVAASTIALLKVNNELNKFPEQWPSSAGTPSPSDSGLGSMDEEIRWSRRGSLFSAPGSRRGSLATPSLLNVAATPKVTPADLRNGGEPRRRSVDTRSVDSRSADGETGITMDLQRHENGHTTIIGENGVVSDEPSEYASGMEDYDDDEVVVAFCGSVMEKYHRFRIRCQEILDELVKQPPPDFTTKRPVTPKTNGINGIHVTNGVHADDDIAPDQIVPETHHIEKVASHQSNGVKPLEQRRVVLEENGDGGILGAGILAAVMDTKEISASFATKHQQLKE